MKNKCLRCIIAVTGLADVAGGQQRDVIVRADYPYVPAFISTTSSPGHTQLFLFPWRGGPSKIPVRTATGPFAYSPDGKALYGECTPDPDDNTKFALCRIDLKTGIATPLAGSIGLYGLNIAVSPHEDCILVAGVLRRDKDVRGLFELTLPSGKIRTILLQGEPSIRSAWNYVSIAPDAKRAAASHNGRLEVIDLVRSQVELLDAAFYIAAWSPDGKWLAAVEKGEEGRTILMDARDLKRVKTLGHSELDWSPDSRYLLGLKSCDEYYGTLQAINVETGERTTIESSKCQINQATTGWVASDITGK
jgi:WD40 repeat protein